MLYLIPTPLGENDFSAIFPAINEEIINTIDDFIVEDLRTGRRFVKKAGMRKPIDTLNFMLLNEHTREVDAKQYLQPCLEGKHVGLMSDAGTPCVADPGHVIVAAAHRLNIPVVDAQEQNMTAATAAARVADAVLLFVGEVGM